MISFLFLQIKIETSVSFKFMYYLCRQIDGFSMELPVLESVKVIERQYRTGEEPVLVMCSDKNAYVCKYMRSSLAAYKMVCELIGARMAMAWQIATPEVAFVQIKQGHWAGHFVPHNHHAPAFGSKQLYSVVDVTPTTYREVKPSQTALQQLMKIALFDFWMANEDRNANNANLLYDVLRERIVSIDYGCILNTATYDFPMSQLTSTDTILWSDLFKHLAHGHKKESIDDIVKGLEKDYADCLKQSGRAVRLILDELPEEWKVSSNIVEAKLSQLFEKQWFRGVWENFMECLSENIRG